MFYVISAIAPTQLHHLTKHRANLPKRRPPSHYLQDHQNKIDLDLSIQGQGPLQPADHSTPYKGHEKVDTHEKTGKTPVKDNIFEELDGQHKHTPVRDITGKEMDGNHSEADSDGSGADSRQVDALLDLQILSERSSRSHEHYKKHHLSKPHTSALSKRLQVAEKQAQTLTPVPLSSTDQPMEQHLPSIAKDSLLLARSKGHLFGSSPKLQTKLTKPAKLPQTSASNVQSNIRANIHRSRPWLDVKYDRHGGRTTLTSRSLEAPDSSQRTRKVLLTEGKSASFDNNFSLIEIGTDSDEEIMV